jgi:hypothetical protein
MIKTCLTYDASREPRHIPSEVGSHRFFQLGYPLPLSMVAVAHDHGHVMEGALAHGRMRVEASHSATSDLEAILFAFQFDRLVLRAAINLTDDRAETGLGLSLPVDAAYIERIWPPQGLPFLWPSDAARIPSS